jgi:hypothetical protein
MDLENILSVSGYPGLYRLVMTRTNGIVIEDLDTAKRNFVSLRKHQFTPLESVGIYTYDDVVGINKVFEIMQASDASVPPPNGEASDLHAYFRKILPAFDEGRVHLSDIRKVIRWHDFLAERNLLVAAEEEE